jgi:hypothetical protein
MADVSTPIHCIAMHAQGSNVNSAYYDSGASTTILGDSSKFCWIDPNDRQGITTVGSSGKMTQTNGAGPCWLTVRDPKGAYRKIYLRKALYLKGFPYTLISPVQLEEMGIVGFLHTRQLINGTTGEVVSNLSVCGRVVMLELFMEKEGEAVEEPVTAKDPTNQVEWDSFIRECTILRNSQLNKTDAVSQVGALGASRVPSADDCASQVNPSAQMMAPIPTPILKAKTRVLVLFSGSGSVELVLSDAHPETEFISVDIAPAKHLTHQMDVRDFCADGGALYDIPPHSVHFMWASPPCSEVSRAHTIGTRNLGYATAMMQTVIRALKHLQPPVWMIENPVGYLSTLPVMDQFSSSLLVVSQCLFGLPYRKDTNIWTSERKVLSESEQIWRCKTGSQCTYKQITGKHQITAQAGPSRNGRPGAGGARITQQIPGKLTLALIAHLPWGESITAWIKDPDCKETVQCNLAFRAITSLPNPCLSLSEKGNKEKEQLALWHQRLAHPNGASMLRAIDQGIVPMRDMSLTTEQIGYICGSGCDDCAVSKARRPTYSAKPQGSEHGSVRPFGRVAADATGPLPAGVFGGKYNMLYVDMLTGWLYGYIMRSRKETAITLKSYEIHARSILRRRGDVLKEGESAIVSMQTDNGKECIGGDFAALCSKMQVSQNTSGPYAHEEMALVERWHGVLMGKTRSLLHRSGVPELLWGFGLLYTIYASNRTPSKRHPGGISPYQAMFGEIDPNIRLVVFGCDAYAFEDPAVRVNKLAPTNRKFILVGVADDSTGFLLLDANKSPPQTVIRSMVRIEETSFTAAAAYKAMTESQETGSVLALDLMSAISEAPPGLISSKLEAKKLIKMHATILEVRPMLHPSDNEIITLLRCSARTHPEGVWAMSHQTHEAVGIESLVSHLMNNSSALSMYTPLYDRYLCKEGANDQTGEPAFLIGIDLSSEVQASRMMLLMGRNDGTWYQADVEPASMVSVSDAEFHRRVQEITDAAAGNGTEKSSPHFLSAQVGQIICHDDDGVPVTEPKNRAQMLRAPDAVQWQHSEAVEIEKNLKNKTMLLTPLSRDELIKEGYEVISANFVCKVKTELKAGKMSLVERKSRLCAHGNEQVNSYDVYTHAATPPYMIIRLILILALECSVCPQQADVNSAFQIPALHEKIVIMLPAGMGGGKRVYAILLKTMQGLKQSSKVWGDTLHSFLIQWDPRIKCVEKAGRCLYCIWTADIKLMCMRYVDDIIGWSSDSNVLFNALLHSIGNKFPLKMLGDMTRCLGTEVTYFEDSVVLRQQKNIQHMIEEYNVLALVPRTPKIPVSADQLSKVVKHDSPQATVPFRNGLGELMWICHTRPDVSYAVQRLASLCNGYDEYSWTLVLQVMKYLHSTIEQGVVLRRSGKSLDSLNLYAYSDASHASCPISGRSVSGCIVFLQDNPIDWSSRPQRTVAVSTVESELMATTECVKDVMMMIHLLSEFTKVSPGCRIHLDSEGATFIASTDKTSSNTRHIAVRHFYCREKVQSGEIVFGHVDGTDNPADMLTKPLERVKLEQYASVLMGTVKDAP